MKKFMHMTAGVLAGLLIGGTGLMSASANEEPEPIDWTRVIENMPKEQPGSDAAVDEMLRNYQRMFNEIAPKVKQFDRQAAMVVILEQKVQRQQNRLDRKNDTIQRLRNKLRNR